MAQFRCPNCSMLLKVIPLTRQTASQSIQSMTTFNFGGDDSDVVLEEPARAANVESDVAVPLYQATIAALAVGLGMVTVALLWGWPEWDWAWWTPLVVAVGVFVISWFSLVSDARNLLRRRWTPPEGEAEMVTVEISQPEAKQTVYAHFCEKPNTVRRFALDCLNQRLTVHSSNVSRRQFERLRIEAVNRGLLVWRNPDAHAQGVELTQAGKHVFQRLLDN